MFSENRIVFMTGGGAETPGDGTEEENYRNPLDASVGNIDRITEDDSSEDDSSVEMNARFDRVLLEQLSNTCQSLSENVEAIRDFLDSDAFENMPHLRDKLNEIIDDVFAQVAEPINNGRLVEVTHDEFGDRVYDGFSSWNTPSGSIENIQRFLNTRELRRLSQVAVEKLEEIQSWNSYIDFFRGEFNAFVDNLTGDNSSLDSFFQRLFVTRIDSVWNNVSFSYENLDLANEAFENVVQSTFTEYNDITSMTHLDDGDTIPAEHQDRWNAVTAAVNQYLTDASTYENAQASGALEAVLSKLNNLAEKMRGLRTKLTNHQGAINAAFQAVESALADLDVEIAVPRERRFTLADDTVISADEAAERQESYRQIEKIRTMIRDNSSLFHDSRFSSDLGADASLLPIDVANFIYDLQLFLNEENDANLATDGIAGPLTLRALEDYIENNSSEEEEPSEEEPGEEEESASVG